MQYHGFFMQTGQFTCKTKVHSNYSRENKKWSVI